MSSQKKTVFSFVTIALAIGIVLFAVLFDPFDPVVINWKAEIEQRPDLKSVSFAKQLSSILDRHGEINIRFRSVVFVKNSVANDELLRAKYTNAAEIRMPRK